MLIVVECDGVLCDVHLDGHREAFNETFTELGMEGMSWSQDEYLSLLRSGGGTAYGMIERYFHFYGYPTPELRDPGGEIPDEPGNLGNLGIVPEGYENASLASQAPPRRLPRAVTRSTKSFWRCPRSGSETSSRGRMNFARMVEEGRLRLRKGALAFLDECLLGERAGGDHRRDRERAEENVLGAVLRDGAAASRRHLRSDANEIIDGAPRGDGGGGRVKTRPTRTKHMDDDALDALGTTRLCTTRRGRRAARDADDHEGAQG